MSQDLTRELQEQVAAAAAARTPVEITGGGTKRDLGRTPGGTPLAVAAHAGIVSYEPKELVVTARAGTPLAELETALAEAGQMLPFEPPAFGPGATLGGTIAAGLSGPRRPYAGSARDLVLGVRLINGQGDALRFGGAVMKNVAGYDISRLVTGAWGTLGLLLEVSLKVLPRPAAELTLVQEQPLEEALRLMDRWSGRPLPLSATAFHGGRLHLRLSGAASAVEQARRELGGEVVEDGDVFWSTVREQTHPFFAGDQPLWRLSVPAAAAPFSLPGEWLFEWGGAQRWLRSSADPAAIRGAATAAGGHATLFRHGDRSGEVFHPLPPALMTVHRSIKRAFDPQGLFNPGRMYAGL